MRIRLASASAALLLAGWVAPGQVPTLTTWTVPGVVKASGLNGTNYVSDLVIANPGDSLAIVTFSFVPALAGAPSPQFLAPGQSVTLKDAVASVFGAAQAVGAILVSSTAPLIIRGRTYNTASAGTFGVSLPVISDDRFLQPGDSADSLWVTQSADGSKGYRTNIALVFPDGGGGDATVTLYDQSGAAMGQQAFSQASAGVQQVSVGSFAAGALPVGRASIQVTRGRAAGYSVVVDNVTGDGSLYSFEDLPAGPQDVIVNGVTRAGGQLGTFWRTDGRLFNADGKSDAAVTMSWLPAGNSNESPRTAAVTVPAATILDLPDILSAVFGLPSGSSGALRVQSDRAVAVLCRTSNLDPTGQRPGTFGAQQKAVPLVSFLMSADAGGLVTGVRQSSAFRTNVGFVAGADGAAYSLTLKSPSGGTTASTSASLGAFGWTQPNVASLFPGSISDDSQLIVKVTAGSLNVYDSFIDNGSGDPVVTEIAALPVTIPSSASIGAAGGSVQSDDGRLTLKIPAGALSSPTAVSIGAGSNGAPNAIGAGYSITPGALSFAKPAQLVLHYATVDVDGTAPDALGLAHLSGSTWKVAHGGTVDASRHTLSVPVGSTGAAVRAAPRTPLLSSTPWGPFGSVVVTGSPRGVFTGGAADFLVRWVGSSSTDTSGGDDLGALPPILGFAWSVNGAPAPAGGSNGTLSVLSSTDSSSATYLAPSCIPPVNPVVVDVSFADTSGRAKTIHTMIGVFSRNWVFSVDENTSVQCLAVGQGNVSYDYGSVGGSWMFSLSDTGEIGNVHVLAPPVRDFSQLTNCSQSEPCAYAMDPTFVLLDLIVLTGRLNPDSGSLKFSGSCEGTATPAISWKCPMASGEIASHLGQAVSFGPFAVGPTGGSKDVGIADVWKYRLTPADPKCGP